MEPICLNRRTTAFAGILGAIIFSVMWLAAIYADGNWILGVETLSDLGHPSRAGHPIFNAATIIAGMLLGIFVLGMYNLHQASPYARMSMIIGMVACLSLMAVGIFPIHVEVYHTVASYTFFGLMVLSFSVWMIHDWNEGNESRPYAYFTATLLIIIVLFLALTKIGLAEAVAVVMIMGWALVQSYRLLKI